MDYGEPPCWGGLAIHIWLYRLLEEAKREMGQLAERRTMEEDYEQRLAALTRALAQEMARADRLQSLADQSLEVSRTVVGIAQTGTYDEEEDLKKYGLIYFSIKIRHRNAISD